MPEDALEEGETPERDPNSDTAPVDAPPTTSDSPDPAATPAEPNEPSPED